MMKSEDLRIARELKSRLSSLVELLDFKVFGSRARGDADEYSDMDVFFEVESLDSELKDKISAIVWEVGFNNYTVISPLIFTRDELENSPLRSSPIVEAIAEEGVAV
jgi:predicted nucleotidyltransferase